jgi:hypothetical protein
MTTSTSVAGHAFTPSNATQQRVKHRIGVFIASVLASVVIFMAGINHGHHDDVAKLVSQVTTPSTVVVNK